MEKRTKQEVRENIITLLVIHTELKGDEIIKEAKKLTTWILG